MPRAFPHTGPETTNDWRYYRLEAGGPLSPDGDVPVVVSAFDGGSVQLDSRLTQAVSEVRIFTQGCDGRPLDLGDWLFEDQGHTDHERCLRAAGYEPTEARA